MKIRVQNFQSLKDVLLEATGLTVIVGPSDRGKSALLRAIEAALFNRPGEQFVRYGEKTAIVGLLLDSGDTVIWEKGGGVNRFTVNGVTYSRVGQKAPDPLVQLGFRDILIGARTKDDGKLEGGEWVRPQVHHQFDGVFLLDKPGPFVNETLVKVSRLGVLQQAGRQCGLDLRQARQLLKTRQGDLERAEEELVRLEPIVAIKARVDELREQVASWQVAVQQAHALRDLLKVRRELQAVRARPIPEKGLRAPASILSYQALAPLVAQRAVLRALPPMPTPYQVQTETVTRVKTAQALRPLMIEQRQQRNWVQQYSAEAARHGEEHARALAALAAAKKAARICPICERPFPKVEAVA